MLATLPELSGKHGIRTDARRAPGLLRQPGRSPYLDTLVITGGFFCARKLPFFVMAATFFARFSSNSVSEALGIDKAPTMW